jgi:hypothetical protein
VSEPIVFVSHFRIKEGSSDPLKRLVPEVTQHLAQEKPRTLAYVSYIDEGRGMISFLHFFGDADSMSSHFEGADERARSVYEFVEPAGWEIYGSPNPDTVETMRQAAGTSGVTLTIANEYVAGFLRPSPR